MRTISKDNETSKMEVYGWYKEVVQREKTPLHIVGKSIESALLPNSYVKAQAHSMTIFGDRAFGK
jgi:hypothetical protein